MLRFLSAGWVAACDDAARDFHGPPDMALVFEQVVTGTGDGDVRFHLEFAGGRLRVRPGPAEAASVSVRQSYATAAAIAAGTTNAQDALAKGELRVSGDVGLLGRHARALAAIGDVFAAVRARTEV